MQSGPVAYHSDSIQPFFLSIRVPSLKISFAFVNSLSFSKHVWYLLALPSLLAGKVHFIIYAFSNALQNHNCPAARRNPDEDIVMCSNGCGNRMKRHQMPLHLRNECSHRWVYCDYCSVEIVFKDKQVCIINHFQVILNLIMKAWLNAKLFV